MRRKVLTIIIFLNFFIAGEIVAKTDSRIDLSGSWQFAIDRDDVGIREKWFEKDLSDDIRLPGSMPENRKGDLVNAQTQWTGSLYDSSYYYSAAMAKYRQADNIKFPFFLTPDFHYVGVAWYRRTVEIPASWEGQRVVLFLERPHIETTVWVDGQPVGESQYSLCVPHIYDLTPLLTAGRTHSISLRIDNRIQAKYDVGKDSHSITDQTQGNWNGVVGRIELQSTPMTYVDDIQVFPDLKNKCAQVKIKIIGKQKEVKLSAAVIDLQANNNAIRISLDSKRRLGAQEVNYQEMTIPMGDDFLTWSEFHPNLYCLIVTLQSEAGYHEKRIVFGMREITIDGKWFYVNGHQTMLRGTVENCCFPLTGYAPTDLDSWLKVFKTCKAHGLNHMRFHSFCPPEAAFLAADLTGVYLQVEGPSWANHGVALGRGMAIDTFLMQETQRISQHYGNYASFCMLASGNEPAGNWVPWVSRFVDYWKAHDRRRVYTGASVGGSWAWQPHNQYHVKADARGLSWNSLPETVSDFRSKIDTVAAPYVSHETGQWCVFPDFNEIDKYTGVYKAKNFEIFRELLRENDMEQLAEDFLMASGKLQVLCYKHEIEKTLRTPDYAGFQLLGLNDYSGQGTALVGVLDVFWDEKPYITATQFRRFCNETVPLTRMKKFVYTNNESLRAQVEIYHFGEKPLTNQQVSWQITDSAGIIIAQGIFAPTDIPIGNCFQIGMIETPLSQIAQASQLNLEVKLDGTDFVNDWDFWVYPASTRLRQGSVFICDSLDNEAVRRLNRGEKVLLLAAGKIKYGSDVKQQLTPVFWNTSWFKMRPPHTVGFLTHPNHPLFRHFPTQAHGNLQWAELVNGAQVMQFTDFPKGFQPLIQHIHTWFLSKKIGSLFEAKVGKGKLLMTTLDLQNNLDERPVAKQLLFSILEYMNTKQFSPENKVDLQQISDLFTKSSATVDLHTKDAPDELKITNRMRMDRQNVADNQPPHLSYLTANLPDKQETLKTLTLVNQYFMTKYADYTQTSNVGKIRPSNIWTRGVYYEGLMAVYRLDPRREYYDYMNDWAEFHQWGMRGGVNNRNADDQCCGQTYLDLYAIAPHEKKIKDITACIRRIVDAPKNDDWTWIDAIQMAMPLFAQLGQLTGDATYSEKMYQMYRYTRDSIGGQGLFNQSEGLWWRDADFLPPYKEPNGSNCYWSRGNGWVYAALARVLTLLPAEAPHRAEYLDDFVKMSEALTKCQRTDGFWNVSLHDENHFGGKESTGTSLFVYGMAWGVNQGLLDRNRYLPFVVHAWQGLLSAVHPNGFVGWMQSTGKEPKDGQPLSFDKIPDFEDFGIGCFLLGGSEIYKLK
jgi:rhamnogalacturonyl hydrolase YesR